MSGMKKWEHLKIPFEEIEIATNNFETCIGKGGYGWVYKGKLSISGKLTTVAVKRLNENLGQGLKEFLTEIDLLYGQQHPNLVSLLAYCDDEKEKIIVYEYLERGSLDKYITTPTLTWLERLKICYDVACGLDHLHNHVGQHQTIIHRDIKSANILLDHNWVAKISDLGLSRLSLTGLDRSLVISHACGTPGYCEPEYIISGTVTKKSDVYSFGMVLFEVLCGKLCSFKEKDGFLLSANVVNYFYKKNKLDQIVDPSLREHLRSDSMTIFSAVAYRCLHKDREKRPSIDVVKKELAISLKIYEKAYSVRRLSRVWKVLATLKKSTSSLLQKGLWFDENTKPITKIRVKEMDVANDQLIYQPELYNSKQFEKKISGIKNPFISEKKDDLWFRDNGKYCGGEYSMAVLQANAVLEDQCQIESGSFGTFVGVYDGHGGPTTARYVCDNLFRNFQETSAKDHGVVTPETIENAFLQTENGFTAHVSQLFSAQPSIAAVGSCCLVGIICLQTLFIANLGDSRVVLGKKGNTGDVVALQLSSEHNANREEVRHELRSLHPHDPQIVTLTHGVWRVKGLIQVSRSIGDVYLKHSEYNTDQIPQKFRLPELTVMPILSATPSILMHHIQPSDSFLIFASDGLWEHLNNQEAVEIVHNNPRAGIANTLVNAAVYKAAKKREMKYSDLQKIDKGVRRHFHDDISVIVLFLDYGSSIVSVRCE